MPDETAINKLTVSRRQPKLLFNSSYYFWISEVMMVTAFYTFSHTKEYYFVCSRFSSKGKMPILSISTFFF